MKKNSPAASKTFTRLLLKWNRDSNDRQMPWKGEKDPYRIWLSEIILQQTRVEQGLQYYNRFIQTFPSIHQLASAPDKKIFKLWEGLGYYSRCRNLMASARFISKELKGKFPSSYETIKGLKGVGPYTAAAISSFAFNLPHAVVDGNVFRVLARYFGINTPTDSTGGKKYFTELANELLDKKQAGIYNQAIMDFGATICKPLSPLCTQCILKKDCVAFNEDRVNELPVKEKKVSIRPRWFYYFIIEHDDRVAIRRRTAKDIWQDLYEFPMVESGKKLSQPGIVKVAEENKWLAKNSEVKVISTIFRQQLSHQLITGQFILLKWSKKMIRDNDWIWINKSRIKGYPFPRFINQYLVSGQI